MQFLSRYINWHYLTIWPKLLVLWRNATLFPLYYFAIFFHLRTLLYPWKRQTMTMGVGFHLSEFLAVVITNLASRTIGCTLRIITILYGLVFMCICLVLFAIPAVSWILLIGLSFPLYLAQKPSREQEAKSMLVRSKNNIQVLATILIRHKEGKFVLQHLGFDPEGCLKLLVNETDEGDFQLFESNIQSKQENLLISDLFEAFATSYLPFKVLLDRYGIKHEDVLQTARWFERLQEKTSPPLIFDLGRIMGLPGIGTNWAYGYTVEFDTYASDITKRRATFPILIGREKELSGLERILSKSQYNNALIVGEPGVGRHILIETLAHNIKMGICPPELAQKRVLMVNMHAVVSSKPSVLEVKGFVERLLAQAEAAGNVIVLIDEFDKYVSNGEGRIDLSDVIAKMAESNIGLICITGKNAYHKYIEPNETLSLLFEKIELHVLTPDAVLSSLELSIVPVLEKKYGIIITYPAIRKTIETSDQYISSTPFPAKAIELLDECAANLITDKKERVLTAHHIDDFLSEKFQMPLGELKKSEKEILANLEDHLHTRIINQEEAIHVLSSALRRARLNISSKGKPIGTFLFLGPTGVGKTETAKVLSEIYFGAKDALLRFDMSQYQKEEGLERLIGSIKLGTPGELISRISDHPFSLILLDEFEKANKEIYNLFLTLLDEGYISDSTGKRVEAKNTIVIATSNAAAEFIRESINKGIRGSTLQQGLIEFVQEEGIFSPELLNRFDAVVVFSPLSEGHLREVARLQLADLNRRLIKQDVSVEVDDILIKKLATVGFNPQFGARAMKRVIAETIEDQVAKRLLEGNIRSGEQIKVQL